MKKIKIHYRCTRGGSSQYHALTNRNRPCPRTYRLSEELVADITYLADKYRVSTNDLAHWLLEESVELLKAGKIEPKVEAAINYCVR